MHTERVQVGHQRRRLCLHPLQAKRLAGQKRQGLLQLRPQVHHRGKHVPFPARRTAASDHVEYLGRAHRTKCSNPSNAVLLSQDFA